MLFRGGSEKIYVFWEKSGKKIVTKVPEPCITLHKFLLILVKFKSSWIFLLEEICTQKIFMVSLVKLIIFIPQNATFAFFSSPIPLISHLSKLGHSPKSLKKSQYHLKHSSLKFGFLKRTLYHQQRQYIGIHD